MATMPKKTKQAKIRAESRRIDWPLEDPKNDTSTPALTPERITQITTIRSDLAKTIVLATVAISAEFFLYFILR